MTYEIRKNVPIDLKGAKWLLCPYPFGKMEVGDSFVVGYDKVKNLRYQVTHYMKDYPEITLTTARTADDEITVWRTK